MAVAQRGSERVDRRGPCRGGAGAPPPAVDRARGEGFGHESAGRGRDGLGIAPAGLGGA